MKTASILIVLFITLINTSILKANNSRSNWLDDDLIEKMSKSKNVINLIESSMQIIIQKRNINFSKNSFEKLIQSKILNEKIALQRKQYTYMINEFPKLNEMDFNNKKEIFNNILLNIKAIPTESCLTKAFFNYMPTCLKMNSVQKIIFATSMGVYSVADITQMLLLPELDEALGLEIESQLNLSAEVAEGGDDARIEECIETNINALKACFIL